MCQWRCEVGRLRWSMELRIMASGGEMDYRKVSCVLGMAD